MHGNNGGVKHAANKVMCVLTCYNPNWAGRDTQERNQSVFVSAQLLYTNRQDVPLVNRNPRIDI